MRQPPTLNHELTGRYTTLFPQPDFENAIPVNATSSMLVQRNRAFLLGL